MVSAYFIMIRRPPRSKRTETLLPYTTLCRSHGLALGQQRAGRFLPADHDVRGPGREPMARIVPHGALLGRDAESIGNPLCRPLVIRRENDADVAVIEDRIMLAVGFIDLIETLGDQIDPDPEIGRAHV